MKEPSAGLGEASVLYKLCGFEAVFGANYGLNKLYERNSPSTPERPLIQY